MKRSDEVFQIKTVEKTLDRVRSDVIPVAGNREVKGELMRELADMIKKTARIIELINKL